MVSTHSDSDSEGDGDIVNAVQWHDMLDKVQR